MAYLARMVRLVSSLVLALAAALLLVRAAGAGRPSLPPIFTNPDGTPCDRPCLFGIRPGETRSIRAVDLIRQHPTTHLLRQRARDVFSPGYDFYGRNIVVSLFTDSSGRVYRVAVVASNWMGTSAGVDSTPTPLAGLRLGNLIDVFGLPESAAGTGAGRGIAPAVFDGARPIIVMAGMGPDGIERMNLEQPITLLSMYARDYFDAAAIWRSLVPWGGFADLRRYARRGG